MSLTALILRNRHAVWALVLAIVVLGFVAYRQIPVRLFPDTAPPMVTVVTSWPGAAASDVQRELTEPIETELAALEGVARTRGSSQDNVSRIQVELHYGRDVRLAAVDVDNAISRLGSDLPEDAERPRVLTFSTADRPVLTLGVRSTDLLDARRVAEDVVGPRLQAVPGVASVDVFGGRVPSVLVEVDPSKAEAHHVFLSQIAQVIASTNTSSPAGRLRTGSRETMLRVDQRQERVEALGERVVATPDGGQLRLGGLATVRRGAVEDDAWFAIDGERAIAVQVFRSEDANTVAVVEAVQEAVDALRNELPAVELVQGEESATFTELSVSNLLGNVWQALLLASIILFFFLGRARAAAVAVFTMPLAFGLTFAAMWVAGMEFNMVTLSAVILAVGMVVDASVVVLENIVRLRDEGLEPLDAARQGADEVRLPVLAGVATTVVVLVPLLGLPGFVGRVFGPLATTLLIAFTSSVLVALVLVPILSLQIRDGGRVESLAAGLSRPFQVAMDRLRDLYLRVLDAGLRRRGIVALLALISFVVGVVGLRGAGMDLLPRMDGGAFTIAVETPSGSSLEQTVAAVESIVGILRDQPEVELVQAQAGFEQGMKFSGGSGVMGTTQGFISVTLSPRTQRQRSIWDIEATVRSEIDRIPGITNVVVKEVGNTAKPSTVAPVIARVSGPDPLVLDVLGDELATRLGGVGAVVEPTRTWRRDLERVVLDVDERRAASLGHSPLSVARALAMGAEGIPAGTWSPELGASEPVLVRYSRPADSGLDEHLAWPLFTGSGDVVPMRAVVSPITQVEQGLITTENLLPVLDVTAQVDGRPLSFVVADAEAAVADLVPPHGYQVTIEGENKDMLEARTSILRALAVSVFAVYLLLVAQFRSWIHPLTVMMAVPLSLVGVSGALWLAGKPVSMPVMVGLVLLVGTVVNNSILLVDVIRVRRDEGMERHQAIREGVASRFRPIMMTSLSTVIGMLPLALELALGAERFSPLATAVIGGLLASTLLTLVVIPVLYDFADGWTVPRMSGTASGLVLLFVALAVPGAARAEEPLTLEEAWELVLRHPAAEAADKQVEAARARVGAATGRLLPEVELSARSAMREPFEPGALQLPIQLPDGSSPAPLQIGESYDKQHAVQATLTQPVFAGGALHHGRVAARAARDAVVADRARSRADLWLRLNEAWYASVAAQEVVALRLEVVESARVREASMQRLVEAGRATEVEREVVGLRRAEAEQALSEARAQAAAASAGLDALVGSQRPAGPVDLVVAARALRPHTTLEGRDSRVDAALARARSARARGRAVTGALLPSVALRATAMYSNPNLTQFPIRAEWGTYWDAAIVARWTLDAGVRWNEASAARLEGAAAQRQAEALDRQVGAELARTQARLELVPERLGVAGERVRLAERALESARAAQNAGRSTTLELLDREADLAMARAAELRLAAEVLVDHEVARTLRGDFGPSPHQGESP